MTILLNMIRAFANRCLRSSAVKLFGGVVGGILFTLLAMRLWSSLGSKYLYMILGGALICVMILIIIYLLWRNLQVMRSRKMETALGETVKQKKQRQKQLKTAIGSLKDKWQTAMDTLKSARINIYDIPWVLLIGEPQSGKTTTLKQSGLDFPIGTDALSGAGGTVNCDWWFTNDAVVIDTAGRFTMPVDTAPDKEEWHAFLRLLAKYRPKCPINNIVVTIPVTSLKEDHAGKLEEKAVKIREKLLEITRVLKIEVPVYIMVSKSDLINGFTEFCASLSSIENTQILGWNAEIEPKAFNPESFHRQFGTLKQRFYKWALRRLRDLPVGKEADQIFSFPWAFDLIRGPLQAYLSVIFKEDKFHAPLLFRGCYFSSGLQEGQAIIRALETGNLAESRQFSASFLKSRPYFIYNFYKKVFLENGLVRRLGNVTQREKQLKRGALIIATIFSLASIWYLWTGYALISRVLEPTRSTVEQVMKTMTRQENPADSQGAGQMVALAQLLERDRLRIASQGVSYRFLRGKNHSVIRDLKNIEDVVLLRGLFWPAMEIAERWIVKHPDHYGDKVQMVEHLALGLGILVQSPPKLYSLEPDILMIEGRDQWMDVEAGAVVKLAYEFPKGDLLTLSHREPTRARLRIRQEISGLNRFWKIYPGKKWQVLKKNLLDANTHYTAMLAGHDAGGMEGTIQGKGFKEHAPPFLTISARLNTDNSGKPIVFPYQLLRECTKDYDRLSTLVETGTNQSETVYYQPTIHRHAGICQEINSKITADLAAYPELTRFLLPPEGALNPEVSTITASVESALKFSPLFTDTHRQMISQNPERILGFMDSWDTQWHTMKASLEKELTGRLSSVTGSGWKKEQLLAAMGVYLSDIIWGAHLKAALAAISGIIETNDLQGKQMTRDLVLPNAARTKWLEEKFSLFAGINSWLVNKYPSRPDISDGTGQITRAMTEVYKAYLLFWNRALEGYDPSEAIVKTKSWSQYRNQVIDKRGLFLDPGSWPFNLLIENVTLVGLNNLKTILGEDRDEAVIALEKKLLRTAYVYSMASGNLGALGTAQDRFYQCVTTLPETSSQALNVLEDGLMEEFNALASFRQRGDSGLGAGEVLARRLEKIQRHGLNLLKQGFTSGFGHDQKALAEKWYSRFKRRYPFVPRELIIQDTQIKTDMISTQISTVASQQFFDFCFDDPLGVEALEKKYAIRKVLEKNMERKGYEFIRTGIQWMDFIYDKNRAPKPHEIKITLGDDNSMASKKFTVLKIRGLHPDGGSKALRLRFSGIRYKSTRGVWQIDQRIPVQFSLENEETRESAHLAISEPDFSFPAFLVSKGNPTREENTREWTLSLEVVDPASPKDAFRIHLIIEWDDPLPEYIPWGIK